MILQLIMYVAIAEERFDKKFKLDNSVEIFHISAYKRLTVKGFIVICCRVPRTSVELCKLQFTLTLKIF